MKKFFVMLAAVAFVVAFTAPSFAAEWSFYGSARVSTFWASEDFGDGIDATGSDDDFDLGHSLQGNSRFGANVKAGDNLTGKVEMGTSASTVNTRVIWGEYDFGGFKLGVGQNYTPLNFFISNQVFGGDTDMLPYGGIYNGRRPMVQAKFGGFKVALVTPQNNGLDSFAVADEDVTIPLIEAAYSFKVAGLSLDLQGGYQTYSVVNAADDDYDVTSYIVAIGGSYNMGPFYFAANYWMGQNVGNMNMWQQGFSQASFDVVDEDVLDNDGYGYLIVAAFTLSDMVRFEAGYGSSSFDVDSADEKDDTSAYYVQATINLAKGVSIVPEIGNVNYGDDSLGADEGSTTYYGLKWQISF